MCTWDAEKLLFFLTTIPTPSPLRYPKEVGSYIPKDEMREWGERWDAQKRGVK
jgi:hypothetical protein